LPFEEFDLLGENDVLLFVVFLSEKFGDFNEDLSEKKSLEWTDSIVMM
jgi:hypothetical protein